MATALTCQADPRLYSSVEQLNLFEAAANDPARVFLAENKRNMAVDNRGPMKLHARILLSRRFYEITP